MARGPGKYDTLCTIVMDVAQSKLACIIIVDGKEGTGFSLNTTDPTLIKPLPKFLRQVADEIERDIK